MAVEEAKEESVESGGKSPMLLVAAAAIVSLLVGGGGAYFFLRADAQAAANTGAAAAEPVKKQNSGASFAERLYSLKPFVVNVTGDGYSRYLKIKLDFEMNDAAVKEELEARLPQIRDAVIVLLSSKRLSDITGFEGKALLKDDIRMRVNDLVESGNVESVLFTEFVVQ